MMNKTQFTKMAQRIIHPHDGVRNPRLVHPARDWIIGLFVSVLFFTGVALWSTLTYLEYQDFAISSEDDVKVDVVVYRESLVQSSLAEFEMRRRRYEALLLVASQQSEAGGEEGIDALSVSATTSDMGVSTSTEQQSEEVTALPPVGSTTEDASGDF